MTRRPLGALRALAPAILLLSWSGQTQAEVPAGVGQEQPLTTAAPDPAGLSPPVVVGRPRDARIDPQKLALAQQIYDVVGAPALRSSLRGTASGLSVQLASGMAEKDHDHAVAMVRAVSDGVASITPELETEAVSHIAREFTAEQLREMLAFYASPTGQLAARRLPLIVQQAVGGMLSYLPQMMKGVEDSYCSRVRCTRAERHAFDDVASRMAAVRPATE